MLAWRGESDNSGRVTAASSGAAIVSTPTSAGTPGVPAVSPLTPRSLEDCGNFALGNRVLLNNAERSLGLNP